MSLEITQEMRDANEFAHFKAIADAQKAKRDALHAHRMEMYPWLKGVRDAQKKLMEKGEY
jgi:hypothetical protein